MELARATGKPVVVLDRVQCHGELAVGSGRPEPEPGGVRRFFLADRAVADGVISAEAAYASLVRLLAEHEETILEGGSISLLTELARHSGWRENATVQVKFVRPSGDFPHRLRERVERMLRTGRTMLDEVRDLWPDPRTHTVLAGIVGYREILASACDHQTFQFTDAARDRLVDVVTDAHLRYAACQVEQFDALIASIRGTG
ncbi:isopentenyl transferase family protein [Streptomyces hokutonensis]|uniref:isopentenyl transferase family protein n=1 Tax=Streptomyces hokutonensis TaxID=1306990 RepID=UPI00382CB94E